MRHGSAHPQFGGLPGTLRTLDIEVPDSLEPLPHGLIKARRALAEIEAEIEQVLNE